MRKVILTTIVALLVGLSVQAQKLNDLEIAELVLCKSPFELSTILSSYGIEIELTASDGERASVRNHDYILNYAFNVKKDKIWEVFIRYRRDVITHHDSYNSYPYRGDKLGVEYDKKMGTTVGHLKITSKSKCAGK